MRLAYSRTTLYVGAVLMQNMQTCMFKWDQHDLPVWNDDNVELFLFVPGEEKNRLCQFVINPLGTVADLRDDNINWYAPGLKVKTERFADRWVLEMKIPFASIGYDRPTPGDFIGARFCRFIHDGEERYHGTAPVLMSAGNGQRARFARLDFLAPAGDGAEAIIAEAMAWKADRFRHDFARRYRSFTSRFAEIEGCASHLALTEHPLHAQVVSEVKRMRKTLDEFKCLYGSSVESAGNFSPGAAKELLASIGGFDRHVAEHAYAVWQTSPWAKADECDLPPVEAALVPKSICFEQAGNEREQVCLNVRGLLCGARLDLRLWPETIEKKGKPFLSSDAFEVYIEPQVSIEGEQVSVPLVRVPGNIVTVSPGKTVKVWVVFNSRGVSPGRHHTTLKFKPLNEPAISVKETRIDASVWNFKLPETRDWPIKSFFWGSYSFNNDETAALELMHDYHVTHGWTQFHRYRYGLHGETGYWTRPDCGRGKVVDGRDFDEQVALNGNRDFLERARELGMRFVIGWSTPRSPEWFKLMTGRLLSMGFDYEDFVFKGLLRDEFVRKDIPDCAENRKTVREWNTNLWFQATLLSTPPPTGPTLADIEQAGLPEFFRQWTVIRGLCKDPGRGAEILRSLRRHGCSIWSYQCGYFMHKKSILSYYRLYPWECDMQDLAGCAIWTSYSPKGDGWDFSDGKDEGICWRGIDTKPVPTRQLQAFREGLEDVAYMDLMKRELSNPGAGRFADRCRKLLDDRQGIVQREKIGEVEAWRLSAGRLLNEIYSASTEK